MNYDNAKTFKTAAKLLGKLEVDTEFNDYLET